MTSGTQVEPGNTLDTNFPTSNIGNGVPISWGGLCEAYFIGPSNGGCYRWRSFDKMEASVAGFITEFEFILAYASLTTEVNTVALCKALTKHDGAVATIGNAARCWRIFIQNEGSYYRLAFTLGEDGKQIIWPFPTAAPGIQVGKVYRIRVEYDLVNHRIMAYVDGVLVGHITEAQYQATLGYPMPQTVAHEIMGGSSSSQGRNIAFLLDNVVWTEICRCGRLV